MTENNKNDENLNIDEAYDKLSKEQKKYFDELVNYALKKPDTEKKQEKKYLLVMANKKQYLKLKIRKNITIACFTNEDSKSQVIKDNEVSIKTRQTEIKVVDEKSFEAAKYMINVQFKRFSEKKK